MKPLLFFSKNLWAHESLHFLSGVSLAVFFYLKFYRLDLAVVCFLVSLFIDADHYTEGFLSEKFNFKWIFCRWPGEYWQKRGKMTIFLHSWEILPIILLLGRMTGEWPLFLAISASAFVHYSVDFSLYTLNGRISVFHYFLVYRWFHHFDFQKLCLHGQKG